MSIGSFSFDPSGMPLTVQNTQVGVFLYDSDEGYTALPNIQCLQLQYQDGVAPPTALFRYVFDTRNEDLDIPNQFDDVWPLNGTEDSDYVVTPDSRLVVIVVEAGNTWLAFDGFPRLPQTNVVPDGADVTFTAVGVPIRCWDSPIEGRAQADGDTPHASPLIATDLPTIFNPSNSLYPTGMPNCTPDDGDQNAGNQSKSFPIFLDENINLDGAPNPQTYWTLSKAVRHILALWNIQVDDSGNNWVPNPDFTKLNTLLDSREPIGPFFDPNNPATYIANPIIIRTFDATNHAWPDALDRLLGYHGFGMRWLLDQDANFNPINLLYVYRKDAAGPAAPKQLSLDAYMSPIVPGDNNVGAMTAAFDYHGVANQFVVETAPFRYEVSIILAPGFTPTSMDYVYANKKQFLKANIDLATATTAQRAKYRKWVLDECGDGHWDQVGQNMSNKVLDLTPIFPNITFPDGTSERSWVHRYRPGSRKVLSKNPNNDNMKAQLAFSRDYKGPTPAIYDPNDGSHWQPIQSDWELLDDRFGIYFNAEDPDHISIGKWTGTPAQENSKTLHGIRSISDPSGATGPLSTQQFFLRLTTVIEGDITIEALAAKRQASPISNIIERRIDAKDHWRFDTVHVSRLLACGQQPAACPKRNWQRCG